jgi:hypothetical protein
MGKRERGRRKRNAWLFHPSSFSLSHTLSIYLSLLSPPPPCSQPGSSRVIPAPSFLGHSHPPAGSLTCPPCLPRDLRGTARRVKEASSHIEHPRSYDARSAAHSL